MQEQPEAVEAFRQALAASVEELQGNRERLVELVPTYSQGPAEVGQQGALPEWDAEPNPEQLHKMSDLMLEYEIISEEFDVSKIIVE